MEAQKNLGIWMDHENANLIEIASEKNIYSIVSNFTFDTKEDALSRSEKGMHNKRQQMQESYYDEIAKEVLKFDHVLLFGPTDAKTELHNLLNKDLHYKDIQIDIESSDNMSENEKIAFVKNYFEKISV